MRGVPVRRFAPTQVDRIDHRHILRVCCGPKSSAALDDAGMLWQWGHGRVAPSKLIFGRERDRASSSAGGNKAGTGGGGGGGKFAGDQNNHNSSTDNKSWVRELKAQLLRRRLIVRDFALGTNHGVAADHLGQVHTWGCFGGDVGAASLGHGREYVPDRTDAIRRAQHIHAHSISTGWFV